MSARRLLLTLPYADVASEIEVAYNDKVLALSPFAYWPLNETGGITADDLAGTFDGSYIGTLPPGDPGIGDGDTVAIFDGTGDGINIAGARLTFPKLAGTISVWAKASVWNDNTLRYIFRAFSPTGNVTIYKDGPTSLLTFLCVGGGVTKSFTYDATAITGLFHIAMTWDSMTGDLLIYINGSLVGSVPGIGAWSGTIGSTTCAIGASTSSGNSSWLGNIGKVAVFSTARSAADVLALATV